MSGSTNYGTGSLQNNTGENNSAFGNYAASSNQSGICITAVGSNALYNNTNGPHNTSIGAGSMFYNKIGDRNTAVGSSALEGPISPSSTTVGSQNVAIGAQALYSNYGDYNVAVGCYALIDNTDGSGNTAVGYQAGRDLSGNSNFNTFLGYNTDISSNTLTYNSSTALGYNATIDASNQIVLGGLPAGGAYPSVKIPGSYVGIGGVYNPGNGFTLDVLGNLNTTMDASINSITVGVGGGNEPTNTAIGFQALYSNTTINSGGFQNTAVGLDVLQLNTDGDNNTAIGFAALDNNDTGSGNTAIGSQAGGILVGNSNSNTFLGANTDVLDNTLIYNNSTALGFNAIIDASNQMVLGGQPASGAYPGVYIPGSYVGIGGVYNPLSGYALDVSGNIQFSDVLIPNYIGTTPGTSTIAIGGSINTSIIPTVAWPVFSGSNPTNPDNIGSFIPGNGVWLIEVTADFNYNSVSATAWNRISLTTSSQTIDIQRIQDSCAITTGNTYTSFSSVIQVSDSTPWYIVAKWGNTNFSIPTLTVRQTRIA